jgi:hypothetical protein
MAADEQARETLVQCGAVEVLTDWLKAAQHLHIESEIQVA